MNDAFNDPRLAHIESELDLLQKKQKALYDQRRAVNIEIRARLDAEAGDPQPNDIIVVRQQYGDAKPGDVMRVTNIYDDERGGLMVSLESIFGWGLGLPIFAVRRITNPQVRELFERYRETYYRLNRLIGEEAGIHPRLDPR